ncbi:hypothetical protein ILUMI_08530 [Ignelater luminosus]|uniref:NADH:ubiquinone oxidoreductase intermediate-associated protein 30 domain-containing protein n=1 Tax=Ignelater luminosus TaxID=2038154 RepID=A0A8K0GAJ7_IGNLU|nr:hypothetical protein ILUMI_08530 [Ignelater luminosus]
MAKISYIFTFILLQIYLVSGVKQFLIVDFNNNDNVTEWREQSDTLTKSGMSKAALVLLETGLSRRAVFFTLLNAQPNGGGFAGVETDMQLNLSNYNSIALRVRGQGKNKGYKFILKHKSGKNEDRLEYCHLFEVPFGDYTVVKLPLKQFKPYFKNKLVNQTEPLKLNEITSIGLRMYGSDPSSQKKQSGVSSLEMDWIIALG